MDAFLPASAKGRAPCVYACLILCRLLLHRLRGLVCRLAVVTGMVLVLWGGGLAGCTRLTAAASDQPVIQDPGQRTLGRVLDDREITALIEVNLHKVNPMFEEAQVRVVSYNGVVLLVGEVPRAEMIDEARAVAEAIPSVRMAHVLLAHAANSTLATRAWDKWIATKVRAKITHSRSVEVNRIKVIVDARVVYLMWLLTQAENERVTQLAASVSDVEKVVRVIELVPDHPRAPH